MLESLTCCSVCAIAPIAMLAGLVYGHWYRRYYLTQ